MWWCQGRRVSNNTLFSLITFSTGGNCHDFIHLCHNSPYLIPVCQQQHPIDPEGGWSLSVCISIALHMSPPCLKECILLLTQQPSLCIASPLHGWICWVMSLWIPIPTFFQCLLNACRHWHLSLIHLLRSVGQGMKLEGMRGLDNGRSNLYGQHLVILQQRTAVLIVGSSDQESTCHRLENNGMNHNVSATTPGHNLLELGYLWPVCGDLVVDGCFPFHADGDRCSRTLM